MGKIEHLEIKDASGFRKNMSELTKEWDEDNVESLSIVYHRKDGSLRCYWSGIPAEMMLLMEIFKRDVIESSFPVGGGYEHFYDGDEDSEVEKPETED